VNEHEAGRKNKKTGQQKNHFVGSENGRDPTAGTRGIKKKKNCRKSICFGKKVAPASWRDHYQKAEQVPGSTNPTGKYFVPANVTFKKNRKRALLIKIGGKRES